MPHFMRLHEWIALEEDYYQQKGLEPDTLVQLHQVIFGPLFILVVLVLPGGLVDIWARLSRRG